MSVVHAWVGAAGPAGARVVAGVTGSSVRLAVADNELMTDPVYFGPEVPSLGIVSIEATGLTAATGYWFQLEDDSVLDTAFTGSFTTHPAAATEASFTFGVSSCAGAGAAGEGAVITDGVSNHGVFDEIASRADELLFFVHLGDLHYRNITSGAAADYRTAYDDVLTYNDTLGATAKQGGLYRTIPLVYVWDDHDYSGNDSDGTYAGKATAASVYRERVPHYPLAEADALYHSFEVGRVLFVVSDTRYYRSPSSDPDGPSKTMLGSAQKTWMDGVLASSTAELLVWLNPTPWMGLSDDTWAGYATERDELVTMFGDRGWLTRMVCVNGDRHALAIDDGDGNTWGGFPVFLAGSLDSSFGDDSFQYNLGMSGGRNRFATFQVTDHSDFIRVTGTGYIGAEVWETHTFTVGAPPPAITLSYDDLLARVRIAARIAALNDNPYFETNVTGWDTTGGVASFVRSTDQAHEGVASALITPAGTPATVVDTSTASEQVATTLTVPLPAGWEPGQLALLVANANDATDTVTGPAGWTVLDSGPVEANSMEIGVWWRLLQSGDSDPAVTVTVAKKLAGALATIQGHDAAAPIAAVGTRGTRGSSSTDVVAGSVTTTEANQLILGAFGEKSSTSTVVTPPAGMTTEASVFTTGSGEASAAIFSESVAVAGATGTRTAVYDVASGSGYGLLVAINGSGEPAPTLSVSTTAAESPAANADADYTASGWLYSPLGYDQVWVGLVWHDTADAVISVSNTATTALTAATWTHLDITAAAPTGTATVGLRVAMLGDPTGTDLLYIDQLELFPGGATAAAVVARSLDQITWTTVRGGADLELTTDIDTRVDDYEFTANVENWYRIQVFDTNGELAHTHIASITPVLESPWIKSIARPFLNRPIDTIAGVSDIVRESRGGVFPVVGRSFPVAVTDVRGSRRYDLTLATTSVDDADDMDLILASGDTIFLQILPDCPAPGGYYAVGTTTETRQGVPWERRWFTLPLTEIAAPGPDVVGATISWQGVVNAYGTWTDLLAAHSTWDSVLELIGSPTDVIVP